MILIRFLKKNLLLPLLVCFCRFEILSKCNRVLLQLIFELLFDVISMIFQSYSANTVPCWIEWNTIEWSRSECYLLFIGFMFHVHLLVIIIGK